MPSRRLILFRPARWYDFPRFVRCPQLELFNESALPEAITLHADRPGFFSLLVKHEVTKSWGTPASSMVAMAP